MTDHDPILLNIKLAIISININIIIIIKKLITIFFKLVLRAKWDGVMDIENADICTVNFINKFKKLVLNLLKQYL